jgi:hypothetical protein
MKEAIKARIPQANMTPQRTPVEGAAMMAIRAASTPRSGRTRA